MDDSVSLIIGIILVGIFIGIFKCLFEKKVHKLKNKKDVEGLIKALKPGTYRGSDSRKDAVKALGELSDTRAIDPLVPVLSDKNSEVREAAANALVNLGWQPKNNIEKAWFWCASRKFDEAAKLGIVAKDPLLLAAFVHSDFHLRETVANAISKIADENIIELLIGVLNNKNMQDIVSNPNLLSDYQRVTSIEIAALILGKIGNTKAVEPLIAKIKAGFSLDNTIKALGELADSRAIKPLITLLKKNPKNSTIANVLRDITGEDFGTDPFKWSKWWADNGET